MLSDLDIFDSSLYHATVLGQKSKSGASVKISNTTSEKLKYLCFYLIKSISADDLGTRTVVRSTFVAAVKH